ncbi:hypothetical protein ACLOJK_016283 [Asimina triloba]
MGYHTLCYWGEHGANVKAATISKEIEKAERQFDLKMTESLLAIQASVARVEALIADLPFLSNHELMLLNLADKFLAAPESVGLEAKLKAVSKMIEMIQLSGGRNSAGMVQSGVERDNDGAPSTPAGDVTPSSSGVGKQFYFGCLSSLDAERACTYCVLRGNHRYGWLLHVMLLGEHGANVNAAAIRKEIEKVERRFDLKMAESLLAIQASVARVEAHIADRPFLSKHELMFLNLADKLLAAVESVGL